MIVIIGIMSIIPLFARRVWKRGAERLPRGTVHVSMNDYLVHRVRDIPRVALEGMRFRHAWPRTEGALGLWVAAFDAGRRQVSVSIWRDAEDLRRFVRSPRHLHIMRTFRDAGALYTTAWSSQSFDPESIWRQAEDRLEGRVPGVPHH